jgi:hypothetical protein
MHPLSDTGNQSDELLIFCETMGDIVCTGSTDGTHVHRLRNKAPPVGNGPSAVLAPVSLLHHIKCFLLCRHAVGHRWSSHGAGPVACSQQNQGHFQENPRGSETEGPASGVRRAVRTLNQTESSCLGLAMCLGEERIGMLDILVCV